ncbi:CBS domain-containing protein [Streptomyces sp. Ag109_O5-10]|uniref:CBS domain-containing protein n=1 Tax=Streptomyces sp. Ag109_O5-10 TaxID=1855349 RepID=UPI000899C0FB|nr:CBS domain-containing protein [Streptomyces sp. Ag109_O5-10]SEF17524.1 BON domain-containing protein [Streptomyces sp. Ag109_O5-10]
MPDAPHIVGDVMTSPAVAVGRDARFRRIVRVMAEHGVSAVPVVSGGGKVVGVVSEADLLPREEFRGCEPTRFERIRRRSDLAKAAGTTAAELMSMPAVTVHPDVTLAQAARLMAVQHVKRLPVVDDEDRLRGVVSRGDLLKVFLRPDEDIEEEVRRTVVSYLFPAFSHAIHVSVRNGIVGLRGPVHDVSLIWVAERLVRAVEGVVGVESRLRGEETGTGGTRTAQ